jgi:hypothetical protein
MSVLPKFPPAFEMGGRKFVRRSQLEHYKQATVAQALGASAPKYVEPEIEQFVALTDAAAELGVSRRWVGRRMVERASSKSDAA